MSKKQCFDLSGQNGITKVSVRLDNEDLWLTKQQMAELYDTTQQRISTH